MWFFKKWMALLWISSGSIFSVLLLRSSSSSSLSFSSSSSSSSSTTTMNNKNNQDSRFSPNLKLRNLCTIRHFKHLAYEHVSPSNDARYNFPSLFRLALFCCFAPRVPHIHCSDCSAILRFLPKIILEHCLCVNRTFVHLIVFYIRVKCRTLMRLELTVYECTRDRLETKIYLTQPYQFGRFLAMALFLTFNSGSR